MAEDVELVKIDVPKALLAAASKAMFGKLPALTPEEHQSGRPWPQRVMTDALARWTQFIGALVGAAGFRPKYGEEKPRKPRPRRIGAEQWQAVKEVESKTGIEGVRMLRAALYLASDEPQLLGLLRSVLQALDVADATKIKALEKLLSELRRRASE